MRVITFSCSSSAKSKFVAISISFCFCSKFGSKVLMLGIMTSGGMIGSKPYARENGVSLVTHLLVVRYAQRTPRSSFGHLPLFEMDFLRQSRIVLLDALACLLPYEYLDVDMYCLMSYFSKNFAKSFPTNYGLLFVTMECGMP
ncbi:hypothetical protein ACFX1W_013522 [Malus domestica]